MFYQNFRCASVMRPIRISIPCMLIWSMDNSPKTIDGNNEGREKLECERNRNTLKRRTKKKVRKSFGICVVSIWTWHILGWKQSKSFLAEKQPRLMAVQLSGATQLLGACAARCPNIKMCVLLRIEGGKNRWQRTTEHLTMGHGRGNENIRRKNGTDDNEYQIDVGKLNTYMHTYSLIEPHNVIIRITCGQVAAETGGKEPKEEEVKEIKQTSAASNVWSDKWSVHRSRIIKFEMNH